MWSYLDNCFPQILDHKYRCQLCHHKVLGWSMNHQQDNQTLLVQKLRKRYVLFLKKRYSLEQSGPCLPRSHIHCPVDVSQTPATLHTAPNDFGQVNSKIESLQIQFLIVTKNLLGFQFLCSHILSPVSSWHNDHYSVRFSQNLSNL